MKGCKIIARNIAPKISKEILFELFSQAAPLKSLSYPPQNDNKIYNLFRFCVVEYYEMDHAEYALKIFEGVELYNIKISITYFHDNSFLQKLFVFNLPFLDEKVVEKIFSKFGECQVTVMREKNNKVKNFGFVNYRELSEAIIAIENMDGAYILGKKIEVRFCNKK